MRTVSILSIVLLLAGCGGAPTNSAAPAANETTPAAPATVTPTPSPTVASTDCGDALTGEIDAKEFTAEFSPGNGGFGQKELDATRTLVTERVHSAADMLCSSSTVGAAKFSPFKRLLIRNAADATEPHVYADASLGRDALVIEYTFENPSSAPSEREIAGALVCWADPKSAGCETDGD